MILIFTGKLHIPSSSACQTLHFHKCFFDLQEAALAEMQTHEQRLAELQKGFLSHDLRCLVLPFSMPCLMVSGCYALTIWFDSSFSKIKSTEGPLFGQFFGCRLQQHLHCQREHDGGPKEFFRNSRQPFGMTGFARELFHVAFMLLVISYSELEVVKWLLDFLMQGGCCTTILLYYHTT